MANNTASTQLRRGVIGPCILVLLCSGPRYGLQLVRELDAVGGLLTSQGTIYPLLNRLQESGFVTSQWEVESDERPKRYYQITQAGREEAETFKSDWGQFTQSVAILLNVLPTKTTDEEPK